MTMTITTPIGDLEVVFPKGTYASVSTPGGSPVKLGAGQYSLNVHFRLADGRWEYVEEKMSSALRPWDISRSRKPVPPTFAAQAVEAARWAVEKAISEDPAVLTEAAQWHAQQAVHRARGQAERLRAELADAERELADAEAVLLAARSAHQN